MVTAGYYGDVDANVDAFCEHGLRTGDIGYTTEEGYLYVLNRIDDRIITGGENVDPGEVAEVLRSHPDIDEAAVVGVDDETWGERVSTLVVPKTETLSATAIESFCRERLAGYKLPRQIAFTDSLPRTASGTVKRPAVRDQLTALDGTDSRTMSDAIDREPTPRLPEDQSTEDADDQSTADPQIEQD